MKVDVAPRLGFPAAVKDSARPELASHDDKGVTLQSFYARIDRDGADSNVRSFLDSRFPLGGMWSMGHISKIV